MLQKTSGTETYFSSAPSPFSFRDRKDQMQIPAVSPRIPPALDSVQLFSKRSPQHHRVRPLLCCRQGTKSFQSQKTHLKALAIFNWQSLQTTTRSVYVLRLRQYWLYR